MRKIVNLILVYILLGAGITNGQTANWINYPSVQNNEYGVYHFRKSFTLPDIPTSFPIQIKSSAQYRLFVNGVQMGSNAANRNQPQDTAAKIDLAPFLMAGKNTVAVMVWTTPADIENKSFYPNALWIKGSTQAGQILNSDTSYRALKSKAYYSSKSLKSASESKMAISLGDTVQGNLYDWNWEAAAYNDTAWLNGALLDLNVPEKTQNNLSSSVQSKPKREEQLSRFSELIGSKGITVKESFLKGNKSLTIPSNQKVSIRLAQAKLASAYPQLIVSEGKGASIKITYLDSLSKMPETKDVQGNESSLSYDVFLTEGGSNRKYNPLGFRDYHYIQLDIETKEDQLILNDLYNMTN